MTTPRKYLLNCFLLILPALIVNLLWASRLPPMWQFDRFWQEIPPAIAYTENITRIAVNVLPVLMPLRVITQHQRIGVVVYVVGLLSYILAWVMMVYFPQSGWSASLIGATASAWSTLPWLIGIGLIGDALYGSLPYRSWLYIVLSLVFVAIHTWHAVLVYWRIS